uniref:RING-type E3 ubiquitin transferase n=2 Tax=Anser TaxID=8842 RepID=A0A8B9EPW4_ANSCY
MDCDCVENMATALDSRCPICLDSWDDASYVLPCLHQFCFRCIQRWAESKPECPLSGVQLCRPWLGSGGP